MRQTVLFQWKVCKAPADDRRRGRNRLSPIQRFSRRPLLLPPLSFRPRHQVFPPHAGSTFSPAASPFALIGIRGLKARHMRPTEPQGNTRRRYDQPAPFLTQPDFPFDNFKSKGVRLGKIASKVWGFGPALTNRRQLCSRWLSHGSFANLNRPAGFSVFASKVRISVTPPISSVRTSRSPATPVATMRAPFGSTAVASMAVAGALPSE